MSKEIKLISCAPGETYTAGFEFAKEIKRGDVTGLFGTLGSGKTQFVKGVCSYFEVKENVNSPTFIIVNEYSGKDNSTGNLIRINHFDLYRLKDISEFKEIGPENYMDNDSICLIEWAEIADEYLKGKMKKVFFGHKNKENERSISYKI